MARYIHCEECNKRMTANAKNYDELYEAIEGVAKSDMFCDGGCGTSEGPTQIKKGEKCFAAIMLNNRLHPNYENQKPENWAYEYLIPVAMKTERTSE